MKKVIFCSIALSLCLGIYFTQKTTAIPNPWHECKDDISAASKVAGFNFPLYVENYNVRAMHDMIEFNFPLDKKRKVTVRKAEIYDGIQDDNGIKDISGVYNKYPVKKTITLKNGVKFAVRGNKNKFFVANFGAESGYYSFYCEQGMNLKDIEHFYKLLEEAEAPRTDGSDLLTIDELMEKRKVDDIVEPVYTQDCFPRTLEKKGVTIECFNRANLGDDKICSSSQVKMIKDYYKKGVDKDPLNDGSGNYCAKEE